MLGEPCTDIIQVPLMEWSPEELGEWLLGEPDGWGRVQEVVDMPYGMQSERLGQSNIFDLGKVMLGWVFGCQRCNSDLV
jgi:hypothetical protein